MSRPIATVRAEQGAIFVSGYDDMTAAIRARCDELRMSRAMLDDAAKLPEGQSGRLLSPVPDKWMMAETLLKMLAAAEYDVVLVPRPGAAERVAEAYGIRDDRKLPGVSQLSALRLVKKGRREKLFRDPNYFKKLGRLGGRARAKSLSPQERRKIAVKAGRARARQARDRRRASRNAPGQSSALLRDRA